jgi:hypothetical protein
VWSTKPYADEVHFSEANLRVYGDGTGVPKAVVGAAVAPESDAEAAELQSLLAGNRQGYASTRVGSAEAVAAAAEGDNIPRAADGAEAGDNDASDREEQAPSTMTGIDEFEVQINTSPEMERMQQLAAAMQPANPAAPTAVPPAVPANPPAAPQPEHGPQLLQPGATLASRSGRPNNTISDYKPHWPLLVHPGSFPHGEGGCPKGMSMAHWVQLLLTRYPHKQFAGNVPFTLHMFNVLQRHDVNSKTNVTLMQAPRVLEQAGPATAADLDMLLAFLQAGGKGPVAEQFYTTASPAAKAMLKAYRITGEGRAQPYTLVSHRQIVLTTDGSKPSLQLRSA